MARICVDGFNLALPRGSGIATYTRGLLGGLRRLGCQTQILFASGRDRHSENLVNLLDLAEPPPPSASRRLSAMLRRVVPRKEIVAWQVHPSPEVITRAIETRLPAADVWWAANDVFHAANRAHAAVGRFTPVTLGEGDATDVAHWTCPLPMYVPKSANVYTIHDLVPLRLPHATLDNKRVFLDLCRQIMKRADRILTVSEQSRLDIIDILGVDERKVFNTYQSISIPREFRDAADSEVAAEIGAIFGLDWKGYFLFYGAMEPKKNLARLIEGYLASNAESPLVIVGGRTWLNEDMQTLLYPDVVERQVLENGVLRRRDRIRQYEYMPFHLLVSLIRGARATLFPSLYEGFGLPIVESMALGAPVLTSNVGATAEIAADAAILVDPYDTRAISRSIRALDQDQALRDDLIERGRRRAEWFSEERYAERLSGAYRGLA